VPGSALLSTGMQQVSDRPFMFSEWISTFPNEFGVEGPAIIGAYGMGLNGWDISFMFQNGDQGRFRQTLGETWDVVAPHVFGIFPAVSRQVLRGDVAESRTIFTRNVDFASLQKGEVNFDDQVKQDYDVKSFSSDTTPMQALAVGRVVVDYVGQPRKTESVNLSDYKRNQAFVSTVGGLVWISGKNSRDGFIIIDTLRTKALVGFTKEHTALLDDVDIYAQTPFSAIYVTSLDDAPIATSKRLLVTTIARARNTGMKMVAGTLIQKGGGPILMEPVVCEITFKRPGVPKIHILDHDGRRTGRMLDAVNGRIRFDGGATKTVYYEVEW